MTFTYQPPAPPPVVSTLPATIYAVVNSGQVVVALFMNATAANAYSAANSGSSVVVGSIGQ
jgi:hypothetical protein